MFKISKHQKLVFPVGIIVLLSSLSVASNFSEHAHEGAEVIPYILHLPFQVYIPATLFLVTVIKKKFIKHN